MIGHAIDPNTIEPGQWVLFVCSECGAKRWHKWLPGGLAYFGELRCRKHHPVVIMAITSVLPEGSEQPSLEDGEQDELTVESVERRVHLGDPVPVEVQTYEIDHAKRHKLPKIRNGRTYRFQLGDVEVYLQANPFPDNGRLGEIFLTGSKSGTLLAAFLDGMSVAISMALQYGCPLESLCSKFIDWKFEPYGKVPDEDIDEVRSLFDYMFRRLALDWLDEEKQAQIGVR